ETSFADGGGHLGDVAHLASEVARHGIDAVGEVLPRSGHTAHHGLAAELAFGADLAGNAGDLAGKGVELIDHRIDGLLKLQNLAADIDGDLLGEITVCNGGGDLGNVAHLRGQVAGHRVGAVVGGLSGAGEGAHRCLTAKTALGADLTRDTRHLGSEGVELVDHRVDGFLELQDLAADVDRDLLGQVAACNGGRHLGDVAYLCRQVARHRVRI